jgi:hypothetical protein
LLAASVPELRTGWLDDLPPPAALQDTTGQAAAHQLASNACAFFVRCPVRIPGTCDTIETPDMALSTGAVIRCVRTEPDLLRLQSWDARQPGLVHQPAS